MDATLLSHLLSAVSLSVPIQAGFFLLITYSQPCCQLCVEKLLEFWGWILQRGVGRPSAGYKATQYFPKAVFHFKKILGENVHATAKLGPSTFCMG